MQIKQINVTLTAAKGLDEKARPKPYSNVAKQ
jgi:hypothetical protein